MEDLIYRGELDIYNYIIYGKPGSGKTLLAIAMSLSYTRIYSNIGIFQDGIMINKPILSYSEIKKIKFENIPGVLIIDEAGINANSKDGKTLDSRILQELLFLSRKKNLSLYWIAQRFMSIDKNARELADCILSLHKIRRIDKTPIFSITKERQKGLNLEWINQYRFDTIKYLEIQNVTYNQLEESRLEKKIKKTGKKQENYYDIKD